MKQIPQLHYEDMGNGPVIVLLHGFMASSRYWHRVTEQLVAQGHRVIALDLLGFGKSPKPVLSKYDYTAQLASINATLNTLQVDKPFKLIGHSMGSLIALRYTSEYPERISKLLLTNMPVLLNHTDAKDEIFGTNMFYRLGLTPGIQMIIWPIFKTATRLRLLPQKIAEGAVSRRSYIFQNTSKSRIRSMRNVIFAARIEADLLKVQAATVLLSGLQDRKRYLDNIATLVLNQNIRLESILAGHHLPLTHPERIVSAVTS